MKKKLIAMCVSVLMMAVAVVGVSCDKPDDNNPIIEVPSEVTLENVSVGNLSLKSNYIVGEKLDTSGGKLQLSFTDDSVKEAHVTDEMVTGFDSTTVGDKAYTIMYIDRSISFQYVVSPADVVIIPTYEHITTEELADGTLAVTGLNGEYPDTVIIPAMIGGKKVSTIKQLAVGDTSVSHVKVMEGVTTIGDQAFSSNSNLDSVTLPNSVVDMGINVFYNCSSLEFVRIGSGVTELPDGTFRACNSLVKVDLPITLKSIGHTAFYGATALDEVLLGDSVEVIGDNSFGNCVMLKNINTEAVLTIGDSAFYNCTALQAINIPLATEVKDDAFNNCTSLTTADLSSLNIIPKKAFAKSALASVMFSDDLTDIGKCAFDACAFTQLNLPVNITTLGISCFTYNTSLKNIVFDIDSPNLTSISDNAFWGCNMLESVNIPKNVTSIASAAFSNAGSALDAGKVCNIDMSHAVGLITLGDSCFSGVRLAADFVVPASIKHFGYGVYSSTSVVNVTFAENFEPVTVYNLFTQCNSLKTIQYPVSATTFESEWISGCSVIESIDLSLTKITEIVSSAFNAYDSGWNDLKKVILPTTGLATIGNSAFSNCNMLTEIINLQDVKTIGDNAFKGTGITKMIIPEGVTSIGATIFANCAEITNISLPSTLKTVSRRGIVNSSCKKLTSITINVVDVKVFENNDCWSLGSESITTMTDIFVPLESLEAYKLHFTDSSAIIKAIA